MIIISDSSVLMNLAKINQLSLLPNLFSEIIIPKAVFEEVVILGKDKAGSKEIAEANWIKIIDCEKNETLKSLLKILDKGEAEAISLALQINADLLIIDEKKGRAIAKDFNLTITGLLGVLLAAKKANLIENVKPIMMQLQEEANFRIGKSTFQTVLDQAGE